MRWAGSAPPEQAGQPIPAASILRASGRS
jgi:hypothetical protein